MKSHLSIHISKLEIYSKRLTGLLNLGMVVEVFNERSEILLVIRLLFSCICCCDMVAMLARLLSIRLTAPLIEVVEAALGFTQPECCDGISVEVFVC